MNHVFVVKMRIIDVIPVRFNGKIVNLFSFASFD